MLAPEVKWWEPWKDLTFPSPCFPGSARDSPSPKGPEVHATGPLSSLLSSFSSVLSLADSSGLVQSSGGHGYPSWEPWGANSSIHVIDGTRLRSTQSIFPSLSLVS